jgi:twitching motility two-component system response regulator PilH
MSNHKILVVDDSSTDLVQLRNVVSKAQCSVITASSGNEAVNKAKAEKPDLIFMDIVMDDMDGYSACREIVNNPETSGIPVVFVSSKKQKADHLWAAKQGGRALISKPYTEDQILDQIKVFC